MIFYEFRFYDIEEKMYIDSKIFWNRYTAGEYKKHPFEYESGIEVDLCTGLYSVQGDLLYVGDIFETEESKLKGYAYLIEYDFWNCCVVAKPYKKANFYSKTAALDEYKYSILISNESIKNKFKLGDKRTNPELISLNINYKNIS